MSSVGLLHIDEIIQKCDDTLENLSSIGMSPNSEKKMERLFSATEVADMVGRSRNSIHRLSEKDLGINPKKNERTGRVLGYSLSEINRIRDHFKTRPCRRPEEKCIRLAVQTFKGGVSKSVSTVYFAQFLALKGYRVLVIDCDPQASATSSFGFVPDRMFDEEDTIGPYLRGEHDSLEYAVIQSYFPGIDLVPSCLPLYEAEFSIFNAVSHATTAEERSEYYHEFSNAISTIEHNYDVVILDSPPALGMISINILVAATAVLVPTPPSLYDFSSTTQYFKMIKRVIQGVVPDKKFDFIKVMPAKVDRAKSKQIDFLEIMRDRFGTSILRSVFAMTSAIPNSASFFQTVFDLKTRDKKVLSMLETVFTEIEIEIRKCWPSHRESLINEGVM